MSDLTAADVALRLVGGVFGSALLLPLGFLANDAIGRSLARLRLYAALRVEIQGGRAAVSSMQQEITETVPRAETIVDNIGSHQRTSVR